MLYISVHLQVRELKTYRCTYKPTKRNITSHLLLQVREKKFNALKMWLSSKKVIKYHVQLGDARETKWRFLFEIPGLSDVIDYWFAVT